MSFLRRFFSSEDERSGKEAQSKPEPSTRVTVSLESSAGSTHEPEHPDSQEDIDATIVAIDEYFQSGGPDTINIDEPKVKQQLSELSQLPIDTTSAFAAFLLGHRIEWREFDDWHDKFAAANDWPRSWIDVIIAPDHSLLRVLHNALGDFVALNPPARFMVVSLKTFHRTWITTETEIYRRTPLSYSLTKSGIEDLRSRGFIRPATRQELLTSLTVADLRSQLERLQLKKTGNKPDLIQRLVDEAPAEVIQQLAPDSRLMDTVAFSYAISPQLKGILAYEMATIGILANWMSALNQRRRLLETVKRWETYPGFFQGFVIHARHDSCGVCRAHDGKEINPDEASFENLPPFHPGCNCWAEQRYGNVLP